MLFREGSRVRQTPEEGRGTYRPKRCGNNNKDEDNSPKNLNDKKKILTLQTILSLTNCDPQCFLNGPPNFTRTTSIKIASLSGFVLNCSLFSYRQMNKLESNLTTLTYIFIMYFLY